MSMTSAYGPPANKSEMIQLIRSAHDKGITFFDTAEAYGPFANEELVGEALQPIREQVVMATRFGFDIAVQPVTELTSQRDNGICLIIFSTCSGFHSHRYEFQLSHASCSLFSFRAEYGQDRTFCASYHTEYRSRLAASAKTAQSMRA